MVQMDRISVYRAFRIEYQGKSGKGKIHWTVNLSGLAVKWC